MAARKMWVMAASPTGQFYQDVIDEDTGEVVTEHVRAETIGGKAVPVPMQLTDTPALRRALMEMKPGTQIASSIVEPSRDQIDAYLGRTTTAALAPAAAPAASPGGAAPAAETASTTPAAESSSTAAPAPSPAAATVDSGAAVDTPADATAKGKK